MYGFQPHPIIPNTSSYNRKKQGTKKKKSSAWWNFFISVGVIGAIFLAATGVGALAELALGEGLLATIASDFALGIGFSAFSYVKGDKSVSTYILNFVFPIADAVVVVGARLYQVSRFARLLNSFENVEPFLKSSAKKQIIKDLSNLATSVRRGEITEDFIAKYKYAFRQIEQKYNIKLQNDFAEIAINWELKSTPYGATQLAYKAMMTTDKAEKEALASLFLQNKVYLKMIEEGKHFKINTLFSTFSPQDLARIASVEKRMTNRFYHNIAKTLAKIDKVLMYADPFYALRLIIKKLFFKRWISLGFRLSIKEWLWSETSLRHIKSYANELKLKISNKFYRERLANQKQNYQPLNSQWIDGIEIKPVLPNFLPEIQNIEAQIVDVIIYFKKPPSVDAKWKEPVKLYKLFYIKDVLPFLSASSPGQYYLKYFAWGWRIGALLRYFKNFEGVDAVFGRNMFDMVIEAKWVYMDADTVYNLYFKNHFQKLKRQFGKTDKELERQLIWSFFWLLNLKYLGSPIAGLITENKNMFRQRFLSRIRSKSKIWTYSRTRHFAKRKYNNKVNKNRKKIL